MSRKLDEKVLDQLYTELFRAQTNKDWRKADDLQRRISRLEEAEERLVDRVQDAREND